MQRPVNDGRQNDSRHGDQQQAAEQGIATGEDFPGVRLQGRDRPHAGQNHRRIFKCIHPAHVFKEMITGHADAQRDRDQCLAQQKTIYHPPVKRLARQQRTGAVFKHGVRVRFRREFSSFQTAYVIRRRERFDKWMVAPASRGLNSAGRRIPLDGTACRRSGKCEVVFILQRFRARRPKRQAGGLCYPKLTGSMSTVSVTSSGNASVQIIFASVWLNLLIARVRSMIW